jgi:hypothetical protein
MIPEKKKTPEEIAALREGLGIPDAPVEAAQKPESSPTPEPDPEPPASPDPTPDAQGDSPQSDEPVIHLDVPSLPVTSPKQQSHSLRKHETPLAPAPPVTKKTDLPTHRHDPRDIAQIRKREALAQLQQPGMDPAIHLRKQTAHPVLYIPGYLLAIAAGAVAYQRVHHITPIVLLALTLAITLYIFIRKPRSRHHAALIFILIFLTAVFGGIHYAPLFKHGS